MNEANKSTDFDVILACLKLSRAMRRCPPQQGPHPHPFPPAVGRLLECAAANPGVSSRELCEMLDLRPSSLSEILVRAEKDGLLSRAVDENDRRVQRVSLTSEGRTAVAEMETARNEDAKRKTSCFTEEEKALFCSLCGKLSEHIEKLALDLPEGMMYGPPGSFAPEGPDCPPPCPGEKRPGCPPCHPGKGRPGGSPLPPGGRYR